MEASWFERVRGFKSPIRVVAAFLWRSRETQAKNCEELQREVDDLRQQLEAQREVEARLRQQNAELQQQVRRCESDSNQSLSLACRGQWRRHDPPRCNAVIR